MSLINDIIERRNLISAWLKVKNHLSHYEGWVDIEELFLFEATLDENLKFIHDRFSEKKWVLGEMTPLPRLKVQRNEDGTTEEIIRQDFWVPIMDQVAWVAVINIIGPILDLQMPSWSFANRLYRAIWYEDPDVPEEKESKSKVGPYRHYTGRLYRSWHVSWALYRRLSNLTWLHMSKGEQFHKEINALAEADQRAYRNQVEYPTFDDSSWRIEFLKKGYWDVDPKNPKKIFFVKIDFEDFFPLLKREAVLEGIEYGLKEFKGYIDKQVGIEDLVMLLKQMLDFSWKNPDWKDQEKLWALVNQKDKGIPVGLYVSGFLANIALLKIEATLQRNLMNEEPKQIAHFRYVDDHIILSNNFLALIRWVKDYKEMIEKIGVKFNMKKSEPKDLEIFLEGLKGKDKEEKDKLIKKAKEKFAIDADNPRQFYTQTLALISDIAERDFGLLDLNEQKSLLEELKHLLKTELQKDEIKNDTRMAFAIYRIIRLIVEWQRDWNELVKCQRSEIEQIMKPKLEERLDEELDEEEVRKINEKINILVDYEREDYMKIIKGQFSNLINTIIEFPDKLRLWRLIVNFCRNTGYEGWSDLKSIFYNKTTRQYKFIKSLIWQELGMHIVNTAKELKTLVRLCPWEIDAQARFFDSINKWKEVLPLSSTPEDYEKKAWNYLENSIKLAKFIKEDKLPKFPFNKPEIYFWAEMFLTSYNSTEPSKLWKGNIEQLDKDNSIVKTLMLMYPKDVAKLMPEQFKKIVSSFNINKMKGTTAWEWEAKKFQEKIGKETNLVTWCEWLNKKQDECNEKNIYDPRIGEWTALEVIRQILHIYLPKKITSIVTLQKFLRREPVIVHPANFVLTKVWTKNYSKNKLTWEYWRNTVRDKRNQIKMISKKNRVMRDDRIFSFWIQNNKLNQTSQINNLLYGIGLLLLGILRKNLSWPARWNLPGYTRDWRIISREWFSLCACSSDALSILEVLLLPRHAESRSIKEQPKFSYRFEEDTIYDPEPIRNLQEMNDRISSAQEKLEKNQINSFLGNPRQLIPITIPDLIKRKWLRSDEENL